jgi:hypothetical protein
MWTYKPMKPLHPPVGDPNLGLKVFFNMLGVALLVVFAVGCVIVAFLSLR